MIMFKLADLLEQRGLTLQELSERVDVTVASLWILKSNWAKAVRFLTLG